MMLVFYCYKSPSPIQVRTSRTHNLHCFRNSDDTSLTVQLSLSTVATSSPVIGTCVLVCRYEQELTDGQDTLVDLLYCTFHRSGKKKTGFDAQNPAGTYNLNLAEQLVGVKGGGTRHAYLTV